jgi:regulator of replication initiation timing
MENTVDIETAEKLQIENILLKNRLAQSETENQRNIIVESNRVLNLTINALRSKYGLDESYKMDAETFRFVKTVEPEAGLPEAPAPEETIVG